MKKLFLFLFASVLSISMFAQDPEQPTGKTKGQAIPYDWSSGIYVSSEAGVGKWYVVPLLESDGGPFKTTGKTADGKTDINITIVNPLGTEVDINCIAYIGDNETSRHFKMAAGGSKSMTFGAGMFVRMGINEVYLYLVTDVTVTEEQAQEQHQAVNVDVQPVESNSVVFTPVDFDWTGIATESHTAAGNEIAKNTETWLNINWGNKISDNHTFKLYVKNLGSAATTIYGGLATDCPATNIQEQTKDVAAGATISKELDPAMLQMMPGTIYIRLKADQKLHVWAEDVVPTLPAQPLFNADAAIAVAKNVEYSTAKTTGDRLDSIVYKANYSTLIPSVTGENAKYYAVQVIITNEGSEDATIVGKVVKNADGDVYSAVSRTYTIQAGKSISKKLDKTLLSNMEAGDEAYALILGGNSNVKFLLKDTCLEENPCVPAEAIDMTIPAAGSSVSKNQAAGTTKWYAVDISAAKSAQADIELTMTAAEAANLDVDIAAACALGEPTQSYTGSSASTTKTLSYSLIKGIEGNVVYVRVKTNKAITVKAEIIDLVKYTNAGWNQTPSADKAARIEYPLTVSGTLKVLGITLADTVNGKITIANGGKLIVGKEGIKGSEKVSQIVIEEGGILLIDPACSSNNKPFVTAYKSLDLGVQEAAGHTLDELHEFIALPIENREAGLGVGLRYANWDRMAGWVANDGFHQSFVGYNVFAKAGDGDAYTSTEDVLVKFKGQLAANKNITLNMPANGWYAFGNSWTAPIALSGIHSQLSGNDDAAVHFYVATPTDFTAATSGAIGLLPDNYYLAATAEIASNLGITEIKPMQGFFLHTTSSYSIELNYNALFSTYAAAPKRAAADNSNKVAVVVSDGIINDFVYMIEGEAGNAHKMEGNKLAIYAEDGLAQVANTNLIGTLLTFQANEATEYTLHFAWLNGETLYLKDLANGNIIAMTADSRYTFNAEPNSISERFQVVGRQEVPTNIENGLFIEGANKRIENGKIVIIKNGVKYDVLGAQL